MNPLDLNTVCEFVNDNIVDFHSKKLSSLQKLNLHKLIRNKNPYLFRAKNLIVASDLIRELLSAYISSSEEKLFGDFLEDLAIYISGQTCGGHKSAAAGIDLEFSHRGVYYIVAVKSGPNWGNSTQQSRQEQYFNEATLRMKQSQHGVNVQPVLGICYGSTRTGPYRKSGTYKLVGQNFWYLISENENLYTDIIEPIGYEAKRHNEQFAKERDQIINRFTGKFMAEFCDSSGAIDWTKIVEFNSGNLDISDWYA
jgi:hypothetical protein